MATATVDNGASTRSTNGALTPNQVRALAYQAGFRGAGLNTIVQITTPESARVPTARYNPGSQEDSRGLAQINVAPTANPQYAGLNLYNPLVNLQVAYKVSKGGTDFSPWTTYTSGAYKTAPTGTGIGAAVTGGSGVTRQAGSSASQGNILPTSTTTVTPPQVDLKSAALQALLHPTPINPSGKVGSNDVLGRLLANVTSGAYTSPGSTTTTKSQVTQAAQAKLGMAPRQRPSIGTFAGYVNPTSGASIGRTDMGLDVSGLSNGHPIRAVADSRVIGISPNWYAGQPYVLFQFMNGPDKGKYYYIAEAINPSVKAGQTVRAGQVVGTYNSGGTGLELGWGSSTPGRTLAQATTGYTEGQVTPAGQSFAGFYHHLK